ncbi:MAG TPA: BLUF domain-containing protein [Burkholderiaceae bacterium]|nr:BLUF domain-containing protein [Burkholderiaceae bacterium]HYB50256.1 BLUF domain-containing protein [Burkholderiaceae bacterium]
MLVRLLYASRSAKPIETNVVESILAQSRKHNPELGITGVLCQSGDVYLQVLEGGREAVNRLYNQIVQDERHREVMLLHFEEMSERRFAGWTMGQVNLATVNPSLLLKYCEKPVLDPHAMSGRAALALLEELIATAQIIGRAG